MDFLKIESNNVKREILIQLAVLEKYASKISPSLKPFINLFSKASVGGKNLRGSLVVLGYYLAGKSPTPDLYKISASLEIFHSSILIHDDIIDNSSLRRGIITIHKKLPKNGMELAICLADLGFFFASKILADSKFDEKIIKKAFSYISSVKMDTVIGEMLDINKHESILVSKLKTARYSISAPLNLGAIFANAPESLLKKLEEFGENLGIAYQIQDDILGIFGKENEIGKPNVSDILEGKNTLIYEFAIKNCSTNQKQFLINKYGNKKISNSDLQKIRKIFIECGALDYANSKALEYTGFAKGKIPGITKDPKKEQILLKLCDFALKRSI